MTRRENTVFPNHELSHNLINCPVCLATGVIQHKINLEIAGLCPNCKGNSFLKVGLSYNPSDQEHWIGIQTIPGIKRVGNIIASPELLTTSWCCKFMSYDLFVRGNKFPE